MMRSLQSLFCFLFKGLVLRGTMRFIALLLLLCCIAHVVWNVEGSSAFAPLIVEQPSFFLWGMNFSARVVVPRQMGNNNNNVTMMMWKAVGSGNNETVLDSGSVNVANGAEFDVIVSVGDVSGDILYEFVWENGGTYRTSVGYRAMPGILCLLPPVVAIVLVVVLREATLGLFAGVWMGAMLLAYFNPVQGFLDTISVYFIEAWTDTDNGEVVVFALLLGGWTALVRKSGGFLDLTRILMQRLPLSSRSAAITIFVLGCIVQLSGHLSIFLLGSSCVDLADQTHLSRDKLALLIDSTASPVASLSLVSSFMAVQVAYIEQEFRSIGYTLYSPFEAFLVSIPQGFYQINILALCLWVSIFQKDLFNMYEPERDARIAMTGHSAHLPGDVSDASLLIDESTAAAVSTPLKSGDEGGAQQQQQQPDQVEVLATPPAIPIDPFEADPQFPHRWWNAVVPFLFMLIVTVISVFILGLFNARAQGISDPTFSELLSKSKAVRALLWGVLCATALTFVMLLMQSRKLIPLMDSWYHGCNSMLPAMLMLVVAWALSNVVQSMSLGYFVGSILGGGLPPGLLPTLVVILSVFVSFASGTSFGTMGVIFPICIPTAYSLAPNDSALMITTIAACISGSCCGDHCSPFSDTTILSALMSGIPNLRHTKTQAGYALLSIVVGLLFGFLPVGFGLNPWIANVIQITVLGVFVFVFGKSVGNYSTKERRCITPHDDTSLGLKGWQWVKNKVLRRDSYQQVE